MSSPAPRDAEPPRDAGAPSDPELMARAAGGDRDAFGVLYARHAPRIMAFVHALLADRATAADAVQETFLAAWRGARRFRPGAPVLPWLFRIARHEAYDLARRRRRRPVAPLDAEPAAAPVAPRDADAATRLAAAVAALPPAAREAFVLVRVLGRPHDEAATLLDVPVGTVKSRLAAADAALRARLRGDA